MYMRTYMYMYLCTCIYVHVPGRIRGNDVDSCVLVWFLRTGKWVVNGACVLVGYFQSDRNNHNYFHNTSTMSVTINNSCWRNDAVQGIGSVSASEFSHQVFHA